MKKNIVFACVENSNRSQMAQAFANIYGTDKVQAYSAGSRPSGVVNPKAIAAMAELDYDLSKHDSKSLDDLPEQEYEYLITMGCGEECPWFKSNHRDDWQIPDPKYLEPEDFNVIRDLIKEKVISLLEKIEG